MTTISLNGPASLKSDADSVRSSASSLQARTQSIWCDSFTSRITGGHLGSRPDTR